MSDHDGGHRFVGIDDFFPAISLPDLDGRPAPLSRFDGEKFIVFMWASW